MTIMPIEMKFIATIRDNINWPKRIKRIYTFRPLAESNKFKTVFFWPKKNIWPKNNNWPNRTFFFYTFRPVAESNIFFFTFRPVAESYKTCLYVSANNFLAETYDILIFMALALCNLRVVRPCRRVYHTVY